VATATLFADGLREGALGVPHGGRKEGRSKARSNLEELSDGKGTKNMGKFGKELIESMQQAARHAADKKVRGLRVSKVELPDVKAIRLSTGGSESDTR
jgi:hypothetical protein